MTLEQLLRSDSTIPHPSLSRIFPEKVEERFFVQPTVQEYSPSEAKRYVRVKDFMVEITPNIPLHPNPLITQSELSIKVHPTNPEILLAAANAVDPVRLKGSMGWYISTDGGRNWKGRDTLPTHTNLERSLTDPAVAVSLQGTLYVNSVFVSDSADVILARSDDAGTSWQQFSVPYMSNNEDKNHCVVDVSTESPYAGRVYVAFTDFDPNLSIASPILCSWSVDNGASFSPPQNISSGVGSLFAQGVNLATGPNGELYAAWSGYDDWPPPVQTRIGFNKSTDGGDTWFGARSLRTINDIRGLLHKGSQSIRVNSFPSLAVDLSNGERRGWIYLVYAERQLTRSIYLITSSDGGETWSEPKEVPHDYSINDRWFPWATVDPTTGFLYVVYYDSRNFSNNDSAQVYLSFSIDGGETFEDILVSDQPFLPKSIPGLALGYMGDYIGVTALNGIVWPCWNDDRTGIYQAYTSRVEIVKVGEPPTLMVEPSLLDFGITYIGYPETLKIELRNVGYPEPLQVQNISSDREEFVPSRRVFQLRSGEINTVNVISNAETTGVISGTLSIVSNDSQRPLIQVPVSASFLFPPQAQISPLFYRDTVSLGDSGIVVFTLRNSGRSELQFITAVSSSWLRVSPVEGTITEGDSLEISVQYNTKDLIGGTYRASISVRTNDPAQPQMTLPFILRVRGVPHIETSLNSIFFGEVSLGYLASAPLILMNTGTDTLFIFDMSLTDNQFFIQGSTRFAIPPRSSRDVTVKFLPIQLSVISSELTIVSNDPETPRKIIMLEGEGVPPPAVIFSSDTIKFALYRGDTATAQLFLGNNGPGVLRWSVEINSENGMSANWLEVFPTDGVIQPRATGVISVTARTRGLNYGTFQTSLIISCNDPQRRTINVPVELTVLQIPNLRLSTYSLHFPHTFIGVPETSTVDVYNAGALPVRIERVTSTTIHFQPVNFSEITLQSRQGTTLNIRHSPDTVGEENGIITIVSDDPIAPSIQLQVSGIGYLPPKLRLQNASLPSPSLFSGDALRHIVTVVNEGGYELELEVHNIPIRTDSSEGNIQILENRDGNDSVFLPYLFYDGLGYRWDIEENGRVGDGTDDAFDGALELRHFPRRSVARLQHDGRELVIGPAPFGAVQLERRIYVPPNDGFIRYLEVISNKTNEVQNVVLNFTTNLGADQEVEFALTSNGKEELSIKDTWIVTDDEQNANDPAVVHVFAGEGAVRRPSDIVGGGRKGLVSYIYAVRVPPNESRSLLHFVAQRFSREEAIGIARALVNGERRALDGMNKPQKHSVENFYLFTFLSVQPQVARIAPGESASLNVLFNAASLSEGLYRSTLVLKSNDPVQRFVTIPAQLTVRNAPHLSFETSSVNFGNLYVGFPDTTIVRIWNTGSDSLRILNIATENSSYTYLGRTQFSLAPQAFRDLRVEFLPTEQHTYAGLLTIMSNDPTNATASISLMGNGIAAPSLALSRDSFSLVLEEKDSLRASFFLRNNDVAPLDITIQAKSSGAEFVVKGDTQATTVSRVRGNVLAITRSTTLMEFKSYLSLLTPTTIDFIVYEANSLNGSFYQVFKSSRTETSVGQKFYSSGPIGYRMKPRYYYFLATAIQTFERFFITPMTKPLRTTFGAVHFGAELQGYPAPLVIPSIVPASYTYYQSVVTGEYTLVPSISPRSATLPPHDSLEIIVSSRSLLEGSYRSVLTISSQNPEQVLFALPIEVTVLPAGTTSPYEFPKELAVEQNYPNPFNPQTVIRYAIKNESRIRVTIFNVLGQKIEELDVGVVPAGRHEFFWNSTEFPSGVYFYTVTAVSTKHPQSVYRETKKMVLVQ